MSSTDPTRETVLLESFFRRHLLSLSRSATWKRSDQPPDPKLDTYFRNRESERMRPADFEIPLENTAAVGRSLDAFWRGSELSGLGKLLMKLGRHFIGLEQKKDISSDIYEMF